MDSTVLIGYLRGAPSLASLLTALSRGGHTLATTCVNLAEVERGLRRSERSRAEAFLGRLRYMATDREAALRAGRYQAEWAGRGRTIHTADALIAGTARAHGAVLLTHNLADFPMKDLRVRHPESPDA
ncbi:MAG: type II toxin-antitoxin system VapC family toxin [Acidimicrobiales bacterium]